MVKYKCFSKKKLFPVRGEGCRVGDDGRPLEPGDDVGGGAVAPVVAPPLPLPLLTTVPLALAPYPAVHVRVNFDKHSINLTNELKTLDLKLQTALTILRQRIYV